MWLLRITGAHSVELRNAEEFSYQNGRLVFRWNATKGYVHKTAKKTQRDRVMILTPEAPAYTETCIKKYPDGPIYRTDRGAKRVQTNCTKKRRGWLLKRPKVLTYIEQHGIDANQVKMYNFRHSFACNYLDRTGEIFSCVMMMGTSVKHPQTRYFHMDEDKLHEKFPRYHETLEAPALASEEAG
ncbi:hypothetical protein [Pirellula sp. SH-Sr6A]|uniref:hypothetical protein n=1 Tax=Pirellula sp. SH-Sr6A TaxID=1632865 RepID=UPI001439011A|nr:hypothetical protein [Pirellula sp. SH-Sr6A]